jgi:TonB family protein
MLILGSVTIGKSNAARFIKNKTEYLLKTTAISFSPAKLKAHFTHIHYETKVGEPAISNDDDANKLTDLETPPATVKRIEDPAYITVEEEPQFKGGMNEFYHFLSKNIQYPEGMLNKNVQGKVFITMTVETDGSLSDIKVIKDIGFGAANEAVRVLKLSPKWEPGYQNGHKVRVRYTIPISFAISKDPPPDTAEETSTAKTQLVIPDKVTYIVPTDTIRNTGTVLIGLDPQMDPLYVVDGKLMANLNNLNPNDIASIRVLTQQPAKEVYAGLYGKKALNGVVVIKTKNADSNN